MATCPNCDSILILNRPVEVGDWVACQECEIELEVTGVDPVTFEVILDTDWDEEDEDWDEEDLDWDETWDDEDWEGEDWDDEFRDWANTPAFE